MRRRSARRSARSQRGNALPLALALLALACAGGGHAPRAAEGRIDLSHWDFSAGSVELAGTWSVCWGQLLAPGAECPFGWRVVGVRGIWSDDSARSPFGGQGVATYRLRLALPAIEQPLSLSAGAPLLSLIHI